MYSGVCRPRSANGSLGSRDNDCMLLPASSATVAGSVRLSNSARARSRSSGVGRTRPSIFASSVARRSRSAGELRPTASPCASTFPPLDCEIRVMATTILLPCGNKMGASPPRSSGSSPTQQVPPSRYDAVGENHELHETHQMKRMLTVETWQARSRKVSSPQAITIQRSPSEFRVFRVFRGYASACMAKNAERARLPARWRLIAAVDVLQPVSRPLCRIGNWPIRNRARALIRTTAETGYGNAPKPVAWPLPRGFPTPTCRIVSTRSIAFPWHPFRVRFRLASRGFPPPAGLRWMKFKRTPTSSTRTTTPPRNKSRRACTKRSCNSGSGATNRASGRPVVAGQPARSHWVRKRTNPCSPARASLRRSSVGTCDGARVGDKTILASSAQEPPAQGRLLALSAATRTSSAARGRGSRDCAATAGRCPPDRKRRRPSHRQWRCRTPSSSHRWR